MVPDLHGSIRDWWDADADLYDRSVGHAISDPVEAAAWRAALGGPSLFGGIGSIVGTLIGVWIPAVLKNGFVIIGVQPYWQDVAVGLVLIAAVWFDQLRRRSQDRG